MVLPCTGLPCGRLVARVDLHARHQDILFSCPCQGVNLLAGNRHPRNKTRFLETVFPQQGTLNAFVAALSTKSEKGPFKKDTPIAVG